MTTLSGGPSHSLPLVQNDVEHPGSSAGTSQSLATIMGTVHGPTGVALSGIAVTLAGQDNGVHRVAASESTGTFKFIDLPPGVYRVAINATGFAPYTSAAVSLNAGELRELPIVNIRLPATTATVDVTATVHQVAQAQVQEQEKQRVLGFLPDYFTSYIWTAAPMTPQLKFQLSLRSAVDPMTIVIAGGLAGIEQKHNTFPGYGQEAEGYAKRFGATYADTVSSRMISRALLPTVLHQDPRYFYRGSGSIRSRLFYALAQSFVCRGDRGQLEPNYSQLVGSFAAAGLSNVYRAPEDRQIGLTFRNGLIIMGSGAVENVLREFVSRQWTSHVPAFAKGKP